MAQIHSGLMLVSTGQSLQKGLIGAKSSTRRRKVMPAEVDSSSTPVPSPYNPENLKCSGTDYVERSVSRSIMLIDR